MRNNEKKLREKLLLAIEHFAHILPAQATIKDFVHHNTLHGFEHLKFEDALKEARETMGAYGFWPQEKFREHYLKHRITNTDIHHVLAKNKELKASNEILTSTDHRNICRKDVYLLALLFPLKKITSCQLKWQYEENKAFVSFQPDISANAKATLLSAAKADGTDNEASAITELWESCIHVLKLDNSLLHPEEITSLTPERAEKMLATLMTDTSEMKDQSNIDPILKKQSLENIDNFLSKVGDELSLGSFLKQMTGVDVQEKITPYLLPYLASWLDEGFAAWHLDPSKNESFYGAWKLSALKDQGHLFKDLPDWKEHLESLPNSAIEAVMTELTRMDIPEDKWAAYITRIALDLPGWSGMFYWRHSHPDYETPARKFDKKAENKKTNLNGMMDYIAVRLVLEHLYIRKLCRELWLIDGNLASIRGYFHEQYSESYVRYALYNQKLPEYLINLSQQLVEGESFETHKDEDWHDLANMIWTWQQCPSSDSALSKECTLHLNDDEKPHHDGWTLFRLAQHLGLCATDISQLNDDQLNSIFACIGLMSEETAGFILLQAYEHHYREEMFHVVIQNQGRGTWKTRDKKRPEAQLFFCMDDREEGFRRHLEHLNPEIETFGAAAFFGVVMNWKDADEDDSVVLCPVVATPIHEVQEIADSDNADQLKTHQKRFATRSKIRDFIHQDSHRSLLTTSVLSAIYAPVVFITLLGKIGAPLAWSQWITGLKTRFDTPKLTRIKLTVDSGEPKKKATPKNRQLGYTITEQANIVEKFLQNNGLQSRFSQLVVMIGHYSNNQNNPHTAAYGCGACGGKFSGPNGRVFAAMANNPDVRIELAKRKISIPDDTWFIGAEHDTCNEHIQWMDEDLVPATLVENFAKLKADLKQSAQYSAHERCRKLASAPKKPTLISALKHIASRGVDFSQARPELGHATIACGFVGRRYLSQGMFMDRRSFLISYDASTDPKGAFLEQILLSAGPVGAGINLEYYFSSVNNDKYGCGSKVVHNLSGLFGVMEGASGDLRTGLPKQMIEIHEPMRLQLMVEASIDTLTEIYKRQASIQQLVGNGWILLSAKDPESAVIHTFNPNKGWKLWEAPAEANITTVKQSQDWYSGHYDHISPALIDRQENGVKHA